MDKVSLEFQEFIKWILHSKFSVKGNYHLIYIFLLVVEKLSDQNGDYQNHPESVAYDPWLVVSFIKTSFATDGLAEYFTVYPGIEQSGKVYV